MKTVVLAALLLLMPLMVNAGNRFVPGQAVFTHNIDTLVDTASGTGLSRATGDIALLYMLPYQSLNAEIIIQPSGEDTLGYGLSDSGYIYLKSRLGNTSATIAQDSAASLPCTLSVRISELVGDTLFGEDLYITYGVMDSLSHVDADGLTTFTHRVLWNLIVRD